MRRVLTYPVIAVLLLAATTPAGAQQTPTPGTGKPSGPAMEQRSTQPRGKPLFTIFGIPVWLNTPVAPPYCNCITDNAQGSPVRSRNGVGRAAGIGG
jgi:hypothetical protein